MVVEEAYVTIEEVDDVFDQEYSSSDMDEYLASELEEKEGVNPLDKDHNNPLSSYTSKERDGSWNFNKGALENVKRSAEKSECYKCQEEGLDRTAHKHVLSDGADSLPTLSSNFVSCSIGETVNNLIFDDELAKQVGSDGIFIKDTENNCGLKSVKDLGTCVGPPNLKGPNQTLDGILPKCVGKDRQQQGKVVYKVGPPHQKGPCHSIEENLTCRVGNVMQKQGQEAYMAPGMLKSSEQVKDAEGVKMKNSKKVGKKMREILELGEKVKKYIYQVEYGAKEFSNSGSVSYVPQFPKISYLQLSSYSLTHYEIINCNLTIEKGGLGSVSVGMWNLINRLGIVNVSEDFDPISKIKELERRNDKEIKEGKGKGSSYP